MDIANVPFQQWLKSQSEAGLQELSEQLDRYYAHRLVARLEQIVDRASSLEPVNLEIREPLDKGLFQEAHEAFLYGFDTASVALCRSLIEHALKDRLPPMPSEWRELGPLIERASREKLLEGVELQDARKVLQAGNDVMHNVSKLRKTAQEVLDCTRIVLNKLYGPDGV